MTDMHFVERMEERWASISKKPIGHIDQSRLIELARKGAVAADTITRLTAEVERLRSLTVVQETLIRKAEADNEKLRAALKWYAEQAEGCRKLGSIGDPFRHALDADGGKRARAALSGDKQ
jgi:hypothetical protein